MIERLKKWWSLVLACVILLVVVIWQGRAEPGIEQESLQKQVHALQYEVDCLKKTVRSQGEWIERFDRHFRHLMGTS